MHLAEFIHSEHGAITVDWVVMTGAVVGLGLATLGVVSGGVENLSGDIATDIAGQEAGGGFDWQTASSVTFSNNFTGGAMGDWNGGQVMVPIDALGEMLVLGISESASLNLSSPEGAASATLSFDLIGGDSLDNEAATLSLNGVPFFQARGRHQDGSISFTDGNMDGVTVTTEVISAGSNLGGAAPSGWRDTVTRVSVTIDDPDPNMTFGVASSTNQPIADEFYGIDNVEFSAE